MNNRILKTNSAFTLIELLVVIAIIGILAGITIPVVSSLRNSARSAQCVSNLRQINAAIHLHINDHKGRFPGPTSMSQQPCYYHSNTSVSSNLAGLLRDYLAQPRSVPERGENRWMQDVFACPGWAASGGFETPSATSPSLTTYVLNLAPWPYGVWNGNSTICPFGNTNASVGTPSREPRRLTDLVDFPLTRTWMLVDADDLFLTEVMGYSADTNYLDKPAHGSSRNVLFYDGHVKKVPNSQFQRYP